MIENLGILIDRCWEDRGSVSGTRSPGNMGQGLGPGLIIKSETGTGSQIHYLRDSGPWPGLKYEKSGIRDWDRDSSKYPETRNSKIRDAGLGPGPRFVGHRTPGLNYSGLSQGLKIFRDTVPVPCRPLEKMPLSWTER